MKWIDLEPHRYTPVSERGRRTPMKWITNTWDKAMCVASEYGLSDGNLATVLVMLLIALVVIAWVLWG